MGVAVTTWAHIDKSKILVVHRADCMIITCARPSRSRNLGCSLCMTDDKLVEKPDEGCIVLT